MDRYELRDNGVHESIFEMDKDPKGDWVKFTDVEKMKTDFYSILWAVERKIPGQSRVETAIELIKKAESMSETAKRTRVVKNG